MRSRAALIGLCALLVPFPAPGQEVEPVPDDVAAELAQLREAWPEVGPVSMRRGLRFEFRSGSILLGTDRLRNLAGDPENANGALLSFLLGHEAWHSVQQARRTPAEFEQMKRNRMLECEADFMGAAAAYRAMARKGLSQDELRAARRAIAQYVARQTRGYARTTAYPPDEMRAQTIEIGWGQARDPGLLRSLSDANPMPETEAGRAGEVCRIVTHAGDGSIGSLRVAWEDGSVIERGPGAGRHSVMKVSNESKRPIAFTFLALTDRRIGEYRSPYDPDDFELFDVAADTVEVAPGDAAPRPYFFPGAVDEEGYLNGITHLPLHSGRAPGRTLVVSRYADSPSPTPFCFTQASQAASSRDRAMLARIGSVALAAEDDFRSIIGDEAYDDRYGRAVLIAPAFAFEADDDVEFRFGEAMAALRIFQSEEEAAVKAEYTRLIALFRQVCGTASVELQEPRAPYVEGEQDVLIHRFAPRASLRLSLTLWQRPIEGSTSMSSLTGGYIWLRVTRDPGI